MSIRVYSSLLKLLGYLVLIIALFHFYFGIESILNSELTQTQFIIIIAQLLFELVFFVQLYVLFISIINSIEIEREITRPYVKSLELYPLLEVIIPIKNVKPEELEQTLEGLRNTSYDQSKLVIKIGDDTENSDLRKTYQKLAEKYSAIYIYHNNKKFKSGMLNLILKTVESEFVAFFDYDQIPHKYILTSFIKIFQTDSDIGYVQGKKEFRKLDNLSKVWSAGLYLLFFEIFQRNKIYNNTVFFSGSTACFRTSELKKLGGFPTYSFTEDNALTVEYLIEGKRAIYFDKVGSIGLVPRNYRLQIAQLWRWSNGASTVLSKKFGTILKSKNLSTSQKIDIIGTLAISPTVVLIYIYTLSFTFLNILGSDSKRLVLFGISSLAILPILVSLVYILLVTTSIYLSRRSEYSEYRYKDILGFVIIAMASNLLSLTSGLTGLVRKNTPDSKRGKWTRDVQIIKQSIFFFLVGTIWAYYSIISLLEGYTSAILPILISLTLPTSLIISIVYRDK